MSLPAPRIPERLLRVRRWREPELRDDWSAELDDCWQRLWLLMHGHERLAAEASAAAMRAPAPRAQGALANRKQDL